jgi:hypothetical protein
MKWFITGSSLVNSVTPGDEDRVALFDTWGDAFQFIQSIIPNYTKADFDPIYDHQVRFKAIRDGHINWLVTADEEFYYRFKAFSGVLEYLQESEKDRRIQLAKAALYWEGKEHVI